MPSSKDAYVSYRGGRRRDFGYVDRPSPLVFVDLDADVDALRTLPRALTRHHDGLLLIRPHTVQQSPSGFLGRLVDRSRYWGVNQRIAVVEHPVGAPAKIIGLDGEELESEDWLTRARAVELEGILEFGQAIWRPRNYHYRLITGEHAPSYVKLADAIREPRDATVLAAWLLEHVDADTGVLLDSGTLTPIAQALDRELLAGGKTIGEVRVVDQLARMATDVDALVDRTSGRAGRLLAIVSVSSSGSMVKRVISALDRRGESLAGATVAVMVDKGNDNPDPGRVDIWTPPLPSETPLVERGDYDEVGCRLCRTPGRAIVVPINPFTFNAMLPTELRPVVPDLDDPRDNRQLWEAAHRASAITVERSAVMAMRSHRSDKVPMGIKFDLERLIADDTFVEHLKDRIRAAQQEEGLSAGADLVLVAEHEHREAFQEFWPKVKDLLERDDAEVAPFPPDSDFSEDLCERIRAAESILVFMLGAVSGGSIQRALVGVQDARKGTPKFRLEGFVVHARPATSREWQTMRNSFGTRDNKPALHYAWKSILPDRSPLREEGRFLTLLDNSATSELSDGARAFLEQRLSLCQRELSSGDHEAENGIDREQEEERADPLILWGALPSDDVLTPNSIYGQGLDAVTTYVAVGSAMAARLAQETSGVPELRVFEVAAMARSYYDPIILSCFIRWMRPHETFWGWTGVEAATTAMHIVNRAEGRHRKLIVPELLLAAGQGKLTAEAVHVIRAEAELMCEGADFADVHPTLEVGLALLSKADAPPPTEGLYV